MNKETFIKECQKIGVIITETMFEKLESYREILCESNKVMNLTNITETEEIYLKHFYDSLCLSKAIDLNKTLTLCDVGTGAGFPGIVLKIVYPNLIITLLEPIEKRCKFLIKVIEKLELKNIEVVNNRAEIYGKTNREKFDVITSRAVSKLKILTELSIPMLKVEGYFIPLKGNLTEELEKSNKIIAKLDSKVEKIIEYTLPIENSNRTLIKIKKLKKTNNIYPRNYSIIKKENE